MSAAVYVRVEEDQNFPHAALEGCETALILFASGFLGDNDARWIRDAGLVATCVDTNEEKLYAMAAMFPPSWEFVARDAYDVSWIDKQFDVVSLDPWTNEFQACADNLEAWCGLARHRVIIGTGHDTTFVAPAGWRVTNVRKRSDYAGGVFWTLLERA